MEKKAICLLSGGLDSCVLAYIAKNLGFHIYALTFNYNQQHDKEINCAKLISEDLNIKNHVIFNLDLNIFKGSILFKGSYKNQNKKLSDIGKKIPQTYVPARNTIFLSIALAYAEVIDANNIFIGVNSNDYSGYPDCRPEYIEAFQNLADLATKKTINGDKIIINTPLLNLSKSEIIRKGFNLNVPFNKTWSCYKGDKNACGKCESCLLRLKGFKDAKLKDQINYDYYPKWY